jgi:hypothetical protein
MKSIKAEEVLTFEYPEEKVPLPRGRRCDNDIRKRRFAGQEDWLTPEHLYDLPAGRVRIFSVLRKKKTVTGKKPPHTAVL